MKRLIFLLSLILCLSFPIIVQAKTYDIQSVNFTTLSTQDMEDTIQSLATKIARDCGIPYSHSSFVVGHDYCLAVGDNVIDISTDL